jgi:hypothetical protein
VGRVFARDVHAGTRFADGPQDHVCRCGPRFSSAARGDRPGSGRIGLRMWGGGGCRRTFPRSPPLRLDRRGSSGRDDPRAGRPESRTPRRRGPRHQNETHERDKPIGVRPVHTRHTGLPMKRRGRPSRAGRTTRRLLWGQPPGMRDRRHAGMARFNTHSSIADQDCRCAT